MSAAPLSRDARADLVTALARAVLTSRGWDTVGPRIAPHHTLRTPLPYFRPEPGLRGLRQLAAIVLPALTDVEVTVGPTLVDGRRVAMQFAVTGKHTGSFGLERPTDRTLRLSGLVESTFDPDLVDLTASHVHVDLVHLLRQMDAVDVRRLAQDTRA